jgi:two-component system, chemotaxis family, sensor kinase CheA
MAKLLFCEDDPLMQRMYERVFRLGGHELTMAADGEQAWSTLEKMDPKPTLVVLDVMMPKMSGFDVLRKIKSDDRFKQIPVVLFTNLAGEKDAEKGIQLGAAMYLVKSQYSPKQILEKISSLIPA